MCTASLRFSFVRDVVGIYLNWWKDLLSVHSLKHIFIGHQGPHLSILRRNVCRHEYRNHGTKRCACELWKSRTWPIKVDDSAGLEKCGSLERSPTIEINKDVMFGSMKTVIKRAQTKRCLENADSNGITGAVNEWMCCCATRLHVYMHCWNDKSCFVAGSAVIRSSANDHE